MNFLSLNIKWFKSKIYLAFTLLISVFVIGVLGFRFFLSYTWIDAIYMTVITVTTVGFGEVNPLDDTAKLFTVFLIVVSVSIYLFAISIFTEYIANGDIFKKLNLKSVENKIKSLKNHTIIVGYGRNGKQAAQKLEHSSRQYLIIEQSQELVNHIIEEARSRGYTRLSLETGSGDDFEPALSLYRRHGFENGAAFGGYAPSAFNQFLHMDL